MRVIIIIVNGVGIEYGSVFKKTTAEGLFPIYADWIPEY